MTIESKGKVIFIMGVSGSGKSSVGRILAHELSVSFIDADDHHPTSNIEKMSQGTPLTDEDRMPWLAKINKIAISQMDSGVVIACSALKENYRTQLTQSINSNVLWVYLKGDYRLILERMKNRRDHFMGADMLKSQFETLEEPLNVLVINTTTSLELIVEKIMGTIKGRN